MIEIEGEGEDAQDIGGILWKTSGVEVMDDYGLILLGSQNLGVPKREFGVEAR